ncbi:MAG: acyltransferase [Verrucomicrobiota bacterium]
MATARITQIDGWRAVAVIGVMWVHWTPASWRWHIPFEIGLFFFLTLTGFLITRILLRDREAGEATGEGWRRATYRMFLTKRFSRILIPCYAAMLFALLLGAPDIRKHPIVYALHVSNFHMADLAVWPSGTAPFWSLAMQMQFYVFWPLLVFLLPKRFYGLGFSACVAVAPVSRWIADRYFPEIENPQAITACSLDYFAGGALLALWIHRGMRPGNPKLRAAAWAAFVGYAVIYTIQSSGHKLPIAGCFQQTLLTFAMVGLISSTLAGFSGPLGRALDHPAAQHIGKISYGLYLFHALVPMLLGWVLPQLWKPEWNGWIKGPRIVIYTLVAWLLGWLCWRWLEGPERVRFLASRKPR